MDVQDLVQIIENYQNGLYLIDARTGTGKSYAAMEVMVKYQKKERQEKAKTKVERFFYITNFKKNLDMVNLKELYIKNNLDEAMFQRDVVLLRGNVDQMQQVLETVEIPKEFQNEHYQKLLSLLNLSNKKMLSMAFNNELYRLFEQAEREFRNTLKKAFKKILGEGSLVEKQQIVIKDYPWLIQLYPAVLLDRYKIIVMTMDKFLMSYDPIIGPSGSFLRSELVKDATLLIDEFDSTKERVTNLLIKRSVQVDVEYLNLFKTIYYNFLTHQRSESASEYLTDKLQNKNHILRKRAEKIFETYCLKYDYISQVKLENGNNFLFNDGEFIAEYINGAKYTVALTDEEKKQVTLSFCDSAEYEKKREKDLSVLSLMSSIFYFLRDLQYYAQKAADELVILENKKRRTLETEMQFEDALQTIYTGFGLDKYQKSLMMQDLLMKEPTKVAQQKKWENINQFYHSGFQLFEFTDSDQHFHNTEIKYLRISEIAEKIILSLAKKSRIIGFSATATCPSVLVNYDLKYFREQLGDQYQEGVKLLSKKTQAKIADFDQNYRESNTRTEIVTFDFSWEEKPVQDRLQDYFKDRRDHNFRSLIPKWSRQIVGKVSQATQTTTNVGQENFNAKTAKKTPNVRKRRDVENRYLETLALFDRFFEKQLDSVLALNMLFPNKDFANFDLDFLQHVFADLKNLYRQDGKLFVLKSENFDVDKQQLLESLAQGERILVMSTYQTVGAGQNLQYCLPPKVSVVELPAFFEGSHLIRKKDFDSLYLGDITHVVTNIYGEQPIEQQQLMKYFIDVEYLYQNFEIDSDTHKKVIKAGMKRLNGQIVQGSYNGRGLLTAESSFNKQMQMVIQAVGRLTRSHIKPKVSYLFISKKLVNDLMQASYRPTQPAPELAALLDYCQSIKAAEEADSSATEIADKQLKNKAERATLSMLKLSQQLRNRYRDQEESRQKWLEIRQLILECPVATQTQFLENPFYQTYYFDTGHSQVYHVSLPWSQKNQNEYDWKQAQYEFKYQTKVDPKKTSPNQVLEFSEERSELLSFMKNPVIKQHFKTRGFATSFPRGNFVMNPVLFNYFYRGALGEAAGEALLNSLGITLEPILDGRYFEYFDFQIGGEIFIDFKNWSAAFDKTDEIYAEHLIKKLAEVGGKKVIVINMLKRHQEDLAQIRAGGKLVTIPFLLDELGQVDEKMKRILMEVIL